MSGACPCEVASRGDQHAASGEITGTSMGWATTECSVHGMAVFQREEDLRRSLRHSLAREYLRVITIRFEAARPNCYKNVGMYTIYNNDEDSTPGSPKRFGVC